MTDREARRAFMEVGLREGSLDKIVYNPEEGLTEMMQKFHSPNSPNSKKWAERIGDLNNKIVQIDSISYGKGIPWADVRECMSYIPLDCFESYQNFYSFNPEDVDFF